MHGFHATQLEGCAPFRISISPDVGESLIYSGKTNLHEGSAVIAGASPLVPAALVTLQLTCLTLKRAVQIINSV